MKTNYINELSNSKEIQSGIYKNHYLIYNRRSTDEPDNQKNSLVYQKAENVRFAMKEQIPIANINIDGFCNNGIIAEKHSAFKENGKMIISQNGLVQFEVERPKFFKLVQLLNQQIFKGVIFLCWDRASRNDADEAIIKKLIKNNVDIRFTLTKYDKSSSGALHMDIDGMFAQHHSRVTSEKVRLTFKNQRERGICTYKAPVGYLNIGSMENKPIDEKRAEIIKRLFELYATGEWTLGSLSKWAIEQGFTMPPIRRNKTREEKFSEESDDTIIEVVPIERLPTTVALQRILTNHFYIGKIRGNDDILIDSKSHKAIVNEQLFNKVQIELKRKKVCAKYLNQLNHPFRGLVRCDVCKRVYTPYEQKGTLYFGSRCKKDCSNRIKNCNINFIISRVEQIISNLSFTDAELAEIDERTTDIAIIEVNRVAKFDSIERQKKKIKEDLDYLDNNKISLLKAGVYTPYTIIEENIKFNQKLIDLQLIQDADSVKMQEIIEDIEKLSELLKTLKSQYIFANPYEKEEIVKILFSELSIHHKTLIHKCKSGISALDSRFVTSSRLDAWLSELPYLHTEIKESIQEIKTRLIPYYN